MDNPNPLAAVEQRLARLERSARRWRLATIGLLAAIALAGAMGAAGNDGVVTVRELRVSEKLVVGFESPEDRPFPGYGIVMTPHSLKARWMTHEVGFSTAGSAPAVYMTVFDETQHTINHAMLKASPNSFFLDVVHNSNDPDKGYSRHLDLTIDPVRNKGE